jgi:hypothetical protein
MKKTIVIALALLVFCACDEANEPYEHEFVVSNDCSNGSMDVWMTFDSDAVRCGANRDLYFGIEWANVFDYPERFFNTVDMYLYSNGDANAIMDSVWILETDSAKISNCEKLSYSNSALKGTFCLNKFDNSSEKDYVSYYNGDKSKNNLMHYVIYRKFDSYKALCAIESSQCTLLYSCLIHYGESYNFSGIPTLDGVNRKNIWCGIND